MTLRDAVFPGDFWANHRKRQVICQVMRRAGVEPTSSRLPFGAWHSNQLSYRRSGSKQWPSPKVPTLFLSHGGRGNGRERASKVGLAIGAMRDTRQLERGKHVLKMLFSGDHQDDKMGMFVVCRYEPMSGSLD